MGTAIVSRIGCREVVASPLRTEFPGALHHVMPRGNERWGIVRDDADRERRLHWPQRTIDTSGCSGHSRAIRRRRGEPAPGSFAPGATIRRRHPLRRPSARCGSVPLRSLAWLYTYCGLSPRATVSPSTSGCGGDLPWRGSSRWCQRTSSVTAAAGRADGAATTPAGPSPPIWLEPASGTPRPPWSGLWDTARQAA